MGSTRSCSGPVRPGTAGRPRCVSKGDPPDFTGDFYSDVVESIGAELPEIHIHGFTPLEVWQGRDPRRAGAPVPHQAARRRAGDAPRDRGRGARRQGPPPSLPGQGEVRRMGRGDDHRPRAWSVGHLDPDVRPHRRAGVVGGALQCCGRSNGAPVGSPSSSRSPSSTWGRRSSSRAAPAPALPGTRWCWSMPSPASPSTASSRTSRLRGSSWGSMGGHGYRTPGATTSAAPWMNEIITRSAGAAPRSGGHPVRLRGGDPRCRPPPLQAFHHLRDPGRGVGPADSVGAGVWFLRPGQVDLWLKSHMSRRRSWRRRWIRMGLSAPTRGEDVARG